MEKGRLYFTLLQVDYPCGSNLLVRKTHNALDDAQAQAEIFIGFCSHLNPILGRSNKYADSWVIL